MSRVGAVMRSLLVLALVLAGRDARADYVNGAPDDIRQAEAVLLARAQTDAEARAWPAPAGQRRLVVSEVLVGMWFERHVIVDAAALGPGARAVVFMRPRYIGDYLGSATEPPPVREAPYVVPLGAGDTVPLPREGGDGRIVLRQPSGPLTLAEFRAIALKVRPREIDLAAAAIDAALLRPPGSGAPAIAAALWDIARDVPRLAALLESPDAAIRAAAAKRLVALAGGERVKPSGTAPAQLAAWHTGWLEWYAAHRDTLLAGRHYPAVPSPLVPPAVMQPTAILATLDRGGLAAAFAAWLDSGVVRDRELRGAFVDEKTSRWPGADLEGVSFASNPGYASLDALLDTSAAPATRMAALAAIVIHAHSDRFAAERALAMKQLATAAPCSSDVRAAAYWEIVAMYNPGLAHAAWKLLGACADAQAVAFVELGYRTRPDLAVMTGVGARLDAKDPAFATRLLGYIRTRGDRMNWAARDLLASGDRRVVPMAIDWLRDASAETRISAADLLQRAAEPSTVPALIAALRKETDDGARRMELYALAPIADKRAYGVVMALATSPAANANRLAIAMALGVIADKRALPTLAALATGAGTDQQGQQAAVNAFCHITGRCKSHAPSIYSGSVDPKYIADGLAAIAAWQSTTP